jgi:hypothetical protein
MTGSDPEVGDALYHVFNLVIADDPIMAGSDDPTFAGQDAVPMLDGCHRHVRVIVEKVIRSL